MSNGSEVIITSILAKLKYQAGERNVLLRLMDSNITTLKL